MSPEERVAAVSFRALQEAWEYGHRRFWERRARDFEFVLTGDRRRTPSAAELAARPDIAEVIAACRAHGGKLTGSDQTFLETAQDVFCVSAGAGRA